MVKKTKDPMSFEELVSYFQQSHFRFVPIIADGIKSKSMSPIEAIAGFALWTLNETFGTKNLFVTQQKKIGNYTVDFEVIYQPYHNKDAGPIFKIVIECDGHEFHEKTKEQASKDKKRDRELQKLGYTVLRYSGSDLYNNWRTLRDDVEEILDPWEKKEIEEWLEKQRAEGWQ